MAATDTPAKAQPVPFEIAEHVTAEGAPIRIASNGGLRLTLLDADGKLCRRRGVSGLALKPAAELLLPQVNALAGELLARPDMPAQEAVGRLLALAGQVPTAEPQRHEWALAELDGVRVYTNGVDVIVTRQDLQPC